MDPIAAETDAAVEEKSTTTMTPTGFHLGVLRSIETEVYLWECSGCEECEEDGTCMNDVPGEPEAIQSSLDLATVLGEVFGIPADQVSEEALAVGRELELDEAFHSYTVLDQGDGRVEVFFREIDDVRQALGRFVPESMKHEDGPH